MVVYADILVVLNLIVDYFLLKASEKILKRRVKWWRMLLSATAGALFSLYIFFPQSGVLTEFAVRFFMNCVMAFICFGFRNLKMFLKSTGVLFAVTCIYAGVMIALWQILRPDGMIINNSMVYFDISPIVLIISTVVGYFLYIAFAKVFSYSAKFSKKCEIKLSARGQTVNATAIIDTGNSAKDIFSKSEIIIVDSAVITSIFGVGFENNQNLNPRLRMIPLTTVSGNDMLKGYRCDFAEIFYENKSITIDKPIAAISKTPLKENYSAIINPQTLEIIGDENEQTEKLSV